MLIFQKKSTKKILSSDYFEGINKTYWNSQIKSALKRNLEFSITMKDIWNLYLKQNKKCSLTGSNIYFTKNGRNQTASIDRIDSSKGYTIDNIQLLLKEINWLKLNLKQDYFIYLCKTVTEHQNNNLPKVNDSVIMEV